MPAIHLEHVDYHYVAQGRCFPALRDIDLTIADGEFLCVIGPSGCGKTTLLRLLSGLQLPSAGEIRIGGKPVHGPGSDRAAVFQNDSLFPWMTARKNVQFALRHTQQHLRRAEARQAADDALRKVDMLDAADKYPYQLSGGMCQRVAIARALAVDAETLLLDEPFGALDAKIRAELQELLETLWYGDGGKQRKTVVFVTHDIREALRLADRIVFMQPGKVAAEIPVDLPRPRDALGPEDAARLSLLRKELLLLFRQSARAAEANAGMEAGSEGAQ